MRRLARFLKKYRFQVIAGPIFKLIEAIFELIVPLVMADMIDVGVANHDVHYIWQRGGLLIVLGIGGTGFFADLPDLCEPCLAGRWYGSAQGTVSPYQYAVLSGAGSLWHTQPDYAHDRRH